MAGKLLKGKRSKTPAKEGRARSRFRVQGGPIFACIDMGTNSFHMVVCQASDNRKSFEVLMKVKEAVPFFRRSLSEHFIDDAAQKAAMRILRDMLRKARERGATSVMAVATSAVRESKNGEAALAEIRRELDLDARMISGKEEARLIYLGVLWAMPSLTGTFAIADIGGGSTELIVADRKQMFFAESYKLGAARLTQRFFRRGEPSIETIRELHDEVRGVLRPVSSRLSEWGGIGRLIGTSGTVQSLAKLDRDASKLTLASVEQLVAFLEEASLRGERIKGVSIDRNQTILAGSIVLLETMRSLSIKEVSVCSAALREGVIVDRFLQTGWLNAGLEIHRDPRSSSVHNLLEKYGGSFEHHEQVARLATEIFLQTRGLLHHFPEQVGHLLWSAAMLHDIGMFVGRNGHHKHSYYLIRNGGLTGHSEEEVALIAAIARYHRGSEPKVSHEAFAALQPGEGDLVSAMAAILRIAEALDRSHKQVVKQITVIPEPFQKGSHDRRLLSLVLKVAPSADCYSELWALSEKKAFFENIFNMRLNVLVETNAGIVSPASK